MNAANPMQPPSAPRHLADESILDTLQRRCGRAPWWLVSAALHTAGLLLFTLTLVFARPVPVPRQTAGLPNDAALVSESIYPEDLQLSVEPVTDPNAPVYARCTLGAPPDPEVVTIIETLGEFDDTAQDPRNVAATARNLSIFTGDSPLPGNVDLAARGLVMPLEVGKSANTVSSSAAPSTSSATSASIAGVQLGIISACGPADQWYSWQFNPNNNVWYCLRAPAGKPVPEPLQANPNCCGGDNCTVNCKCHGGCARTVPTAPSVFPAFTTSNSPYAAAQNPKRSRKKP